MSYSIPFKIVTAGITLGLFATFFTVLAETNPDTPEFVEAESDIVVFEEEATTEEIDDSVPAVPAPLAETEAVESVMQTEDDVIVTDTEIDTDTGTNTATEVIPDTDLPTELAVLATDQNENDDVLLKLLEVTEVSSSIENAEPQTPLVIEASVSVSSPDQVAPVAFIEEFIPRTSQECHQAEARMYFSHPGECMRLLRDGM